MEKDLKKIFLKKLMEITDLAYSQGFVDGFNFLAPKSLNIKVEFWEELFSRVKKGILGELEKMITDEMMDGESV